MEQFNRGIVSIEPPLYLLEKNTKHRRSTAAHHQRRSSAFFEVGLGGDDAIVDARIRRSSRPKLQVRFQSQVEEHEPEVMPPTEKADVDSQEYIHPKQTPLPSVYLTIPRMLFLVCLLTFLAQTWIDSPLLKVGSSPLGAKAGAVMRPSTATPKLQARADAATNYCTRWSQQSAVVNGTVYLYGGRAKTQSGQTSNTWNNDFLTLNLSTSWDITTPTLQTLPQPSGPPAVANGYLWNSFDALYLYGGEFSDTPVTSPVPFATWSYDIASARWQEHANPQESPGQNSDGGSQPVQRAAEGAGVTVPSLGRGYYFGGHLDYLTTAGWSDQVARVYLTSLLEYTFPGYTNPTVGKKQAAGADGIYRNITQAGSQSTAGFPERADGVLVYVPGFGAQGIILGLAGGTNETFTQMNIIDVYDIANSTWYKQATSGPTPEIRVNPCAVAVSAADGSSTQVYMYGGQNLIPYGNQTQYSDVWILTIPSFTWISVDTSSQSVPPARAGHSCNVWNGQMVVVGGYVGTELSCDYPGIYVFNTSSLSWQNRYTALAGSNTLNQQKSQESDPAALQGSYSYQVPAKVQSVIGGAASGGATVTAPAVTAAQGPLATGKPITYTVTGSDGSTVTETAIPSNPGSGSDGGFGNNKGKGGGTNIGAIVAGVVAGLLAVLATYLAFCVYLYRRQLQLYKNHVALTQRAQLAGDSRYIGVGVPVPGKSSETTESRNSNDSRQAVQSSGNGSGRGPSTGYTPLNTNNPYRHVSTANSSTEDLQYQEPSFVGVLLNPRRSLRVVNRD